MIFIAIPPTLTCPDTDTFIARREALRPGFLHGIVHYLDGLYDLMRQFAVFAKIVTPEIFIQRG